MALPQWVAWWSVAGEGRPVRLPNGRLTDALKAQAKPLKLPINPGTGGLAATTRPTTWSSFEYASAAVQRWSLTGIGFVFTDCDPYSGVDIDNCRNPETGEIADWAQEIIRALDSYTEASPSGAGVHILVRGKLPAGQGNQVACHDGKVEMFSRARYFTVTGEHVAGTPKEINDRQDEILELHTCLFGQRATSRTADDPAPKSPVLPSDDELIGKARRARNGRKFERLWNGQWESDYPSQSEADLALCSHLAFWTAKDPSRMDRLFRSSGMMRDKWLREDYRDETLSRAIAATGATWTSRESQGARGTGSPRRSESQAGVNIQDPRDAADWEPPVPFHEVEVPAFPIDALPDWLRAFVEALAMATQTPVDLAAMLALSVIAAACAKKVIVRIKEGYHEPVNIFTATALPPGNRKSAVFAAAIKPLEEHEESEARRTALEIAKQTAAHKIKQSQLKRLQDQAGTAKDGQRDKLTREAVALAAELAETVPPSATRYIADDCTPERLATLLRDQGGRIAVMSPEGDVFDLLAGRYSAKGMTNFGVYLKGHAGDSIRIDRVGRPPEYIKAPALTVGLAVQPEVISGLAEKPGFRGRGLIGRFLYALPASLVGRRDPNAQPVPEEIRAGYRDHVISLLNQPFETDENGECAPHVLRLSGEASETLRHFEAWLEPQLSEFGELGGMTDWAGKLGGAVGRIVGILHMALFAHFINPWEIFIERKSVEDAINIGRYLIPHAKAAMAAMGADVNVEQAKTILRWIQHRSATHFTKRDLHQGMRGRFKRVEALDAPLALLLAHGFIRRRPERSSGGPGRKHSPTFDVNPLWAPHAATECEF